MQTRLENYYVVKKTTTAHAPTLATCFIYKPEEFIASFDDSPGPRDVFLSTKTGIKLYYRKPVAPIEGPIFPTIESTHDIPLLKSNLQKSIRRCQTNVALLSALCILQRDPMELFRRLPIICIEDVCLLDSYPILIWWMMAFKDYPQMTSTDSDILLRIVYTMCQTKNYFDTLWEPSSDTTGKFLHHKHLSQPIHRDCLLSLYYRSLYGGLHGDMEMLKRAVYYYMDRPTEILTANLKDTQIDYDAFLGCDVPILSEAIDHHPFPQIIGQLHYQTGFPKNEIRDCIWYVESGVNLRKEATLRASSYYSEYPCWKRCIVPLRLLRQTIIYR